MKRKMQKCAGMPRGGEGGTPSDDQQMSDSALRQPETKEKTAAPAVARPVAALMPDVNNATLAPLERNRLT